MVAKFDHCFCFAGFRTDMLRCERAMKTAGRENPNHRATVPRNRAHGAVGQNKSRSIKWAAKQEKFPAEGDVFFLTSTFIELTRTQPVTTEAIPGCRDIWRHLFRLCTRNLQNSVSRLGFISGLEDKGRLPLAVRVTIYRQA
jgi:hypothetical protein